MSFLLNYLDEALDSVTGRYDGHEADQEAVSERVSVAEGGDGGEAALGPQSDGVSSNKAEAATTPNQEPAACKPSTAADGEGDARSNDASATPAAAAAAAAASAASVDAATAPVDAGAGSAAAPAAAVTEPAVRAGRPPVTGERRADGATAHPPAIPATLGIGQGLMESQVREAPSLEQNRGGDFPADQRRGEASSFPSAGTSLMQPLSKEEEEGGGAAPVERGGNGHGCSPRESRKGEGGALGGTVRFDASSGGDDAAERREGKQAEGRQGSAAAEERDEDEDEDEEKERKRQLLRRLDEEREGGKAVLNAERNGREGEERRAAQAAAETAEEEEEEEEERRRALARHEEEEFRSQEKWRRLERERLEKEERRLAAEAATASSEAAAAASAAAAAAAAAAEEEEEEERHRREEEEERVREVSAQQEAGELHERETRTLLAAEREHEQREARRRANAIREAAATAAAAAAARMEQQQQQRRDDEEREQARVSATESNLRSRGGSSPDNSSRSSRSSGRRRAREALPGGIDDQEVSRTDTSRARHAEPSTPRSMLTPRGTAAPAVAAASATAGRRSSRSSSSRRDQAREEAWAAARTLAEEKARAKAMRDAARRSGARGDDAARGSLSGGGGGSGAGVATVASGENVVPTSSPPATMLAGTGGLDRDTASSRPGGSVALNAVAESGESDALARRPPAVAVTGAPEVSSGGWRGFFSGRRQEGGARTGSATSSVSGSQVSTTVDVAPPPPSSGNAISLQPSSTTSNVRPNNTHDFQRVKRTRKPRGGGGIGNVSNAGGSPPPPAHECAACLGLWDGGGSALNRWYRCRNCGATVHGACRQFLEAGEACVAVDAERKEGGEVEGTVEARPVGWRDPVNRAGVVQVGVLQAFGLSLKPGESVYVALRLLPWKERVKTGSAKWGDLGASWPSHPSARHDLLHLYNSDATPVPTLRVEVWRSAMRVLDDLLGYAAIDTAPLLARPGSTSERWHVLFNPSDDPASAPASATASAPGPRRKGGPASPPSSPPLSASVGTVLLSLEFVPTGGTPGSRPLPGTPQLLSGPGSRTPRHLPPASPGFAKKEGVGGSGGGGDGGEGLESGRGSTPRRGRPAEPELSSVGESAEGFPIGGGGGSKGSTSVAQPALSPAGRMVDSRPNESPHGSGGDGDVRKRGAGSAAVVSTEGKDGKESVFFSDTAAAAAGIEGAGLHPRADGEEAGTGDADGGALSAGGSEEEKEGEGEGRGGVHLFRVKSYPAPTWCEICDGLLLGMRNQGFCCEACGMNVHRGCQLRANFSMSCPGQGSKNKEPRGEGDDDSNSNSNSSRSTRMVEEGVGLIQIHLRSAHRCGRRCQGGRHSYLDNESGRFMGSGTYSSAAAGAATASTPTAATSSLAVGGRADAEKNKGFQGNGGVFSPRRRRRAGRGGDDGDFVRGDHYCRVRVGRKGGFSGLAEEVRTEAVFQTPDPVFERTWMFVAPSYDSCVTIDLVDASNDKTAGRFETTVIALLQADYDARAVGRTPPSETERKIRLLSPGAVEDDDNVTGLLQARVEFDESTEAFFGPNGILGPSGGKSTVLRKVPPRNKADLGVETLKSLVARIKAVFEWFTMARDCYGFVMSWENPTLSSISLLAFVYLTLVANAEYLLALLPFSLLLFMTWGFLSRRNGGYVQRWVSAESSGGVGTRRATKAGAAGFRAVGNLKIAVVRGKGLVSSDLNLPGNAYVRVSYLVPDSPGQGGRNGGMGGGMREYLVGQTVPQPTGACPDWGSVGGRGGGGGGRGGGGGGAGGSAAGTRSSSVSMVDQSRGPGFLSNRSDAVLQNMMDVWSRHDSPPSPEENKPSTTSERSEERTAARQIDAPSAASPTQEGEDMCFVYPVLQPPLSKRASDSDGGQRWSGGESRTFLKFSVFFANPFNSLMDALQGQVVIPVSALAGKEKEGGAQPEIRGWFDVSPAEDDLQAMTAAAAAAAAAVPTPPDPSQPGADLSNGADVIDQIDNGRSTGLPEQRKTRPGSAVSDATDADIVTGAEKKGRGKHSRSGAGAGDGGDGGEGAMGSLFLRLQLVLPDGGSVAAVTEEDVQASLALQTLLGEEDGAQQHEDRDSKDKAAAAAGGASSGAARGGSGGSGDLGGEGRVERDVARDAAVAAAVSGGGAVARLLGMPMGLRNTVRDVQDTIGTVLDTLEAVKNLLNWTHPPKTLMVYTLVAIAWLVLLMVPGRYIVLALGVLEFSKVLMVGSHEEPRRERGGSSETPPLAIKLRNLLMSLPVDSELAACYSWEAREFSKKEKAARKLREQRAKLKLLGAGKQWEGAMRVRDRTGDPWESRHVVVLGHRLAWWGSAQELDEGKKARGQLLLQGHAGITHLSPVEAKELSDPRKVVCVFGRSPDGLPHKVTFMGETVAAKEALENAVSSAVETKRD